jgi:hypothetical protein
LTRTYDLGWLLMVAATAVACTTPFEVSFPKMVPARLRRVPKCPGKDTYKGAYISTAVPDNFSLYGIGSGDSRAYEHTKFRSIP